MPTISMHRDSIGPFGLRGSRVELAKNWPNF